MSVNKELLKHSCNYMLANIATKALAFVSIPIYTRILAVEEYGVVGVFMSIISIVTVLLTLNSEVSISRYYYDAKDESDFKNFVGTSINLTICIIIIMTLIFVLLSPIIAAKLSFPRLLTLCVIPVSLYSVTNSIFVQIYNPLMKSKKIAIVSSIQTYMAFGLSVICILCLSDKKYYGYVMGNVLAMIILSVYIIRNIQPYYKSCFKTEYIKYILNYCLPYMPYTLSGIILSQFSRIVIGNSQGYIIAGSYTLTTNIAALMLLLISVTHSAWNPYYFSYMNNKDYKSIDQDYGVIWRATLFTALVIAIFGSDIGLVLTRGGDYVKTLYVIPILVVGYIFYQWAYVYLRNTGYAKRNIWNAYCVLASGTVNIGLNVLLVPVLYELGAALATLISFIFLMFISFMTNRYVIKEYVPRFFSFLLVFLYCLPVFIIAGILNLIEINLFVLWIVKFVLLLFSFFYSFKPFLKLR